MVRRRMVGRFREPLEASVRRWRTRIESAHPANTQGSRPLINSGVGRRRRRGARATRFAHVPIAGAVQQILGDCSSTWRRPPKAVSICTKRWASSMICSTPSASDISCMRDLQKDRASPRPTFPSASHRPESVTATSKGTDRLRFGQTCRPARAGHPPACRPVSPALPGLRRESHGQVRIPPLCAAAGSKHDHPIRPVGAVPRLVVYRVRRCAGPCPDLCQGQRPERSSSRTERCRYGVYNFLVASDRTGSGCARRDVYVNLPRARPDESRKHFFYGQDFSGYNVIIFANAPTVTD